MKTRSIESSHAPSASGGYSQAYEVSDTTKTLYISGQIPVDKQDNVPTEFADQAQLVWQNIIYQLEAADMNLDNIVKHTTYLSNRKYREENSQVRKEILKHRKPALTVVIAGIYDEAWLLEVDVIATS